MAVAAAVVIGLVTVVLLDRSETKGPPLGGSPTTTSGLGARVHWSIVDMDTGRTSPFTLPRVGAGNFDPSPDGSQVAYTALDEQGRKEVFVMRADGSNESQLTFGAPAFVSDWSPDGSMIAFNRIASDSSQEIFLLDMTDRSTTRLTYEPRDAIIDSPEAWTPDGRSLLFIVAAAGDLHTYVAKTIDITTRKTRTISWT